MEYHPDFVHILKKVIIKSVKGRYPSVTFVLMVTKLIRISSTSSKGRTNKNSIVNKQYQG